MTSRLPSFARFVSNFSTSTCAKSGPQINDDGSVGTADAKIYQPRFCACIAASLLSAAHSVHLTPLDLEHFNRHMLQKFRDMVLLYENEEADRVPRAPTIPSDLIPPDVAPLLEWKRKDCDVCGLRLLATKMSRPKDTVHELPGHASWEAEKPDQ